MFGSPIGPWVPAFAWLPVDTIDAGWVWLRFYRKRRVQKHQYLFGGADLWWQNRRYMKWEI